MSIPYSSYIFSSIYYFCYYKISPYSYRLYLHYAYRNLMQVFSFLYTCCTDVIQQFLRLYASKYCSTYISTIGMKQHVSMLQCCIVYRIWVYQNIAKCDWILVKYILYRKVVNKNILRNQTHAGLLPGLK